MLLFLDGFLNGRNGALLFLDELLSPVNLILPVLPDDTQLFQLKFTLHYFNVMSLNFVSKLGKNFLVVIFSFFRFFEGIQHLLFFLLKQAYLKFFLKVFEF